MLEKLSLYLGTFENKHKKFLENFSKFLLFLLDKNFNEILERQLLHCQMQAYGRDWTEPIWGAALKLGGGQFPPCHTLTTATNILFGCH